MVLGVAATISTLTSALADEDSNNGGLPVRCRSDEMVLIHHFDYTSTNQAPGSAAARTEAVIDFRFARESLDRAAALVLEQSDGWLVSTFVVCDGELSGGSP